MITTITRFFQHVEDVAEILGGERDKIRSLASAFEQTGNTIAATKLIQHANMIDAQICNLKNQVREARKRV